MSDDLTEKQRTILEVIRENPEMTKEEIAEAADTSTSYVTRVQNDFDVSDLDDATESTEREPDDDTEEQESTTTESEDTGDSIDEFDPEDITAKGGIGGIVLALLLFGGVLLYYQTQIVGSEIPLLVLA